MKPKITLLAFLFMMGALTGLTLGCGGGSSVDGNAIVPTATPTPSSNGIVVGKVVDNKNNRAITGAIVTDGSSTTRTGSDGSFSFSVSASPRKQITVTVPGYAEIQRICEVRGNQTSSLNFSMLRSTLIAIQDLKTGATLNIFNTAAQVVLPADALVTAQGQAPVFPVKASLTPIDPTHNASLMPGDYTNSDGGQIQSFGAMDITFTDSNGAKLNLASEKKATLRIPIASFYFDTPAPSSVPAFYYNPQTGRWVEEGTLFLKGSGIDQYYEGTVPHFSVWNADKTTTTTCLKGKVVRKDKTTPVEGALVEAVGTDYVGITSVLSAADGTFTIPVKADAKLVLKASKGILVSPTPDLSITTGAAGSNCAKINNSGLIVVDGYLNLTGTLRDFSPSIPYIDAQQTPQVIVSEASAPFNPSTPWINPDFECRYGDNWKGMVSVDLGTDNKPVYNNPDFLKSLIHSKDSFDAWWKDFPSPHGPKDVDPYQIQYSIPLAEEDPVGAPGVYTYLSDAQFPIDGKLQGNYIYNNPGDGNNNGEKNGTTSKHNFHYTYEIHTTFTYKKGQEFSFKGDDDVWVFINKKLVIDLGGVHSSLEASVKLDDLKTDEKTPKAVPLIEGQTYQFDFFYCERHTTESHMRITTSIPLHDPAPIPQ